MRRRNMTDPDPYNPSAMELPRFAGIDEYVEYSRANERQLSSRWRIEQALPDALIPAHTFAGTCSFCQRRTTFALPSLERSESPNLREELVCATCGLNARVRAALSLLRNELDAVPTPVIYLTEQDSIAYAQLLRRYESLVGTEYFSDEAAKERIEAHLEHLLGSRTPACFGDVTALTFPTGKFDAVVSFDVLEHVPRFKNALAEFARVLKPGGVLVLTAPFLPGSSATLTRATLEPDGTVRHLLQPEYHGDPLQPEGVLCFYHFGWDLLDSIRSAGFSSAQFALPWSLSHAEVGGCWTLVARR